MTQFSPEGFPAVVTAALQLQWERLQSALQEAELLPWASRWDEPFRQQLQACLLASDYVADQLCRHPRLLQELVDSGDLQRRYSPLQLNDRLLGLTASVADEAELSVCLRQFRRREMVRIIWRDSSGLADYAHRVESTRNSMDWFFGGKRQGAT